MDTQLSLLTGYIFFSYNVHIHIQIYNTTVPFIYRYFILKPQGAGASKVFQYHQPAVFLKFSERFHIF